MVEQQRPYGDKLSEERKLAAKDLIERSKDKDWPLSKLDALQLLAEPRGVMWTSLQSTYNVLRDMELIKGSQEKYKGSPTRKIWKYEIQEVLLIGEVFDRQQINGNANSNIPKKKREFIAGIASNLIKELKNARNT